MRRNVSVSEISDLIDNCDFQPKRYHVLTTVNEENAFGAFEMSDDSDGGEMLDPWQWVIAAGEGSEYKPGDKVMINVEQMSVQERDPNDTTKVIEYLKMIAVQCGEDSFTIIPDSMILGKKKASLDTSED